MLNAETKQFNLNTDGTVFYQENITNPLPGVPVGTIAKGEGILSPAITPLSNEHTAAVDAGALQSKLNEWITAHIATTLEVLVNLTKNETENADGTKTPLPAPVIGICEKLYNGMGVIPRSDIADLITQLDTETRRDVRAKRVKLGPILVFQPDLNKPAAVRLRAQLWALFNGKTLGEASYIVPADGIVSMKIDADAADKDFYRMIGYPVYGTRAIRIDMLDRVINLIYDIAERGKFTAQHQMAEWLGCPIDDLYAILSAMGHTKIEDEPKPEDTSETASETTPEPAAEKKPETTAETETAGKTAPDTSEAEVEAKPAPQVKPTLATFYLKKGKAAGGRAPYKGQDGQKTFRNKDKPKFKGKDKGKRNKKTNQSPKVMSAGPKKPNLEDSPFAILQQLKGSK